MVTHGVHQIELPTPFHIGTVNAYLLEGDPPALVDCGPDWAPALAALESALAARGRAVSDVGLIVLTHQHVDHVGLAAVLARRSGAAVACLDALGDYLEDYDAAVLADDDARERLMGRHGMGPELAAAVRASTQSVRRWAGRVDVAWRLADGDELDIGPRRFVVQHRPGHSPSDTLLWDGAARLLIAGDHLLLDTSSNAVVDRSLTGGPVTAIPRALADFRRSLLATRALGAETVLGGHGEPVRDPTALIGARLRGQDERAVRILGLLDGELTAWEIAQRLFGTVSRTQPFLTLSEVLGHLGLLADAGRIAVDDSGDIVRVRPTVW